MQDPTRRVRCCVRDCASASSWRPSIPCTRIRRSVCERDRELIQWLDELGFDEAWIGEHHSAGYEIIASPELFIADVAARTKHIRLGTGVVSLPYHQPLMVADRMTQLDHMTRGRAMFGVGPGLLPSDAMMLGIDPRRQRGMMSEALDAIIPLLRGEVVTMKTDWFELRDAKLQLAPYSRPHLEMAVAASVSPSGPRTAGRWGIVDAVAGGHQHGRFQRPRLSLGHLSRRRRASTDRPSTAAAGASPDRCTSPRPSSRRAKTCASACRAFSTTSRRWSALPGIPEQGTPDECLDAMIEAGFVVCGTPDDLISQIERLETQCGGFGAFLVTAHEWANRAATRRSYELIARYVMPRFQDSNAYRQRSMQWVQENRSAFLGAAAQGMLEAIAKDAEDRAR